MAGALLDSLLADGVANSATHPAWLGDARRLAAADLARDGLPGARSEAWKYTNLRALDQRRYVQGDAAASTRVVDAAVFALPGIDGPCLVFVNGVYRADLSRSQPVDGLILQPLSVALADDADALRLFLARHFDGAAQAFARLNTALMLDGAVLRVAAGTHVAGLVHVVFVGAHAASDLAWQSRLLVELGEDASLKLVEHHVGEITEAHFGNVVSQIALGPRARLDLLQLQSAPETATRIRRTDVVLEADAQLVVRSLEIGALLSRHDLVVQLAGDRASLISRGVFALRGRQHSDTRIDVRHVARDTTCDVVWRGVADQRSRGVFHGGITVEVGADGSDASLSNKNLLLSAQAEIDTQPVLEIHADEVKAAHGATVGQLDPHAMFYLRSRGLSEPAARAMLTLAFCRVAIESITNIPLREHIDALLLARLPEASATGVSS